MPLRFINPNFHVILIHYPLGVFVLGVVLELLSFMWRSSPIRIASKMMIILGALLTIPAATSGIYALYDVTTHQGINDARYQMLRWHVIYMGIASVLAVACAVVALGSSDHWRRKLHFGLLAGVVIAWGLMVVGAWHGGETIYQQGTSVAIISIKDQETALTDLPHKERHLIWTNDKNDPTVGRYYAKYNDVVGYYIGGELQQHLIVAGFAVALAMGALGLSFRRLNTVRSRGDGRGNRDAANVG